jgi:hypothetical protein
MIETKLNANREVERVQMTMEDLRSQHMSMDLLGKFNSIEEFRASELEFFKSMGIQGVGEKINNS